MLSTRINVMFDNKSWERLKAIAKSQGFTASELVRRAVYDQYLSTLAKKRQRAIKKIIDIRSKPTFGVINYKELINEGRKI